MEKVSEYRPNFYDMLNKFSNNYDNAFATLFDGLSIVCLNSPFYSFDDGDIAGFEKPNKTLLSFGDAMTYPNITTLGKAIEIHHLFLYATIPTNKKFIRIGVPRETASSILFRKNSVLLSYTSTDSIESAYACKLGQYLFTVSDEKDVVRLMEILYIVFHYYHLTNAYQQLKSVGDHVNFQDEILDSLVIKKSYSMKQKAEFDKMAWRTFFDILP